MKVTETTLKNNVLSLKQVEFICHDAMTHNILYSTSVARKHKQREECWESYFL